MTAERYIRQTSLPEISFADQTRLSKTSLVMIGAGGLGCAALPYLAAAGIGHIKIIDHDRVSLSNLHRQTIFKNAEAGQNKAILAASYCKSLNPDITVQASQKKLTAVNAAELCDGADIILDGSDNFETKTLLNTVAIETETPLISASVNRFQGQCAIFAGHATNAPCYHCLFPKLPNDARNCNEAGILGTAAGMTGLYQAHLTLCFLLGIGDHAPGTVLAFDYKTHRTQKLTLTKAPSCPHCKNASAQWTPKQKETKMAELLSMAELSTRDHIIVDVRTDEEVANDPVAGNVIHMELQTVPNRHEELPKDKLLAFLCAGNIRSVKAAEYLEGLGYENICVLDKFSL